MFFVLGRGSMNDHPPISQKVARNEHELQFLLTITSQALTVIYRLALWRFFLLFILLNLGLKMLGISALSYHVSYELHKLTDVCFISHV